MNLATKTIVSLALPFFAVSIASASVYTYSQSFDALPSSGGSAAIAGTGPLGAQGSLGAITTGDASWQAARILGSQTVTPVNLIPDTGTSNAGAVFSYGDAASTNRALGTIASGTTVPAFGAVLPNTTASTLNTVTITFKSEQWRSSSDSSLTSHGVVNTLKFSYGFSTTAGITSSNFLSSALMTDDATGNVVGGPPSGTMIATVGLVDLGTNTVTLTGLNWNPGDTLFIRWQDTNDVANDAGLAIDDLLITGDVASNPCPSDLDGSGEVDGGDIGLVLLDFGACPGCPSDLDGSGEVDGGDVGLVLLDFGVCP